MGSTRNDETHDALLNTSYNEFYTMTFSNFKNSPNIIDALRKRAAWAWLVLILLFLSGCAPAAIPVGLELIQPTNNLIVTNDSIIVSGTLSNATELSYSLNSGTAQTLDATSDSFNFSITLREGSNTLTVTAANNSTEQSLTRNIIYNRPPQVELRIIQPASDLTLGSEALNFEAFARNADRVSYSLNSANAVTVNSTNESYSFSVQLRAGENTIVVTAENAGGSVTVTRTVNLTDSNNAYAASLTEASSSFVRPSTGTGLTDAERTVKYHLFQYTATSGSYHEIASTQNNFDGYLMLYESSFDPDSPSTNLIAQNDDSAAYDEITGGESSIRAFLELNKSYVIVTTACGSEDGGCGPNIGNFSNSITANVPAPPPDFELPVPDDSRYNITLRFAEDDITKSVTQAQRTAFDDAIVFWEKIIVGDVENFGSTKQNYPADFVISDTGAVSGVFDDVLIDIKFSNLDGPGSLLGQASPRIVRLNGEDAPLTVWGMMEFDIGEFENGGFFEDAQAYKEVVIHEMAHVLGIGTLWTDKNLVDENYSTNPPRVPAGLPNANYDPGFTGAEAVAEYNKLLTEIGEVGDATVVPISNSGGPGNYNGHWREIVFGNELMTPFAEGLEKASGVTAGSLEDLGYSVNRASPVIATDYELPPPPIAGQLKQTKPNQVTYTEITDFGSANDSIKAEVTAIVQNVDLKLNDIPNSSSGCDVGDYAGFVNGSIALVRRGGCLFSEKIDIAVANNASAIIIMNQGDASDRRAVFGIGGLTSETEIPVMAISYDLGVTLANISGLELYLNTGVKTANFALRTQALQQNFEIISGPIGGMLPDGTIIITGERPEMLERLRQLHSERK